MKSSGCFAFVVACIAVFPVFAPFSVTAAETDGPEAWTVFHDSIRTIFMADNYGLLEKKADELRRSKERYPDGVWKLGSFYTSFKYYAKNDSDLELCFKKLDQWKAAFPNSMTQPVLRARMLAFYAWNARGGGWADSVTDDGWKLFKDRLAQARSVLDEAAKLPARCPEWYAVMQTIALGQQWPRDEEEKLFKEAASQEPEFYSYYNEQSTYLLPRWYGRQGDLKNLAEEAAQLDGVEGLTAYARVAWDVQSMTISQKYDNIFKEAGFEWPEVKQGFLDIEKSHPDSRWNLNCFCRLACIAGDRDTAQSLFKRIGDHCYAAAWDTLGTCERYRRWAFASANDPKAEATLIPPGASVSSEDSGAWSVAFSPDGGKLVTGYFNGRLILWDLQTKQPLWSANLNEPVRSIAFSPDGKLLAAGGGLLYKSDPPGVVEVWDFATKQVRAMIRGNSGVVKKIAFTPDGKSLIIAGGIYATTGVVRQWDVDGGKLQPLDWVTKYNYQMEGFAISPNSQVQMMVTPGDRSINVWDMAYSENLFTTPQNLSQWVQSLDFSPDGKLLVGGCQAKKTQPSDVVIWDAGTWQQHKPAIPSPNCLVNVVAFSPDGKTLAGGCDDGAVHFWDVASGRPLAAYGDHAGPVTSIAFSPDGKTIASASEDGAVKLWDLSAKWPVSSRPGATQDPNAASAAGN